MTIFQLPRTFYQNCYREFRPFLYAIILARLKMSCGSAKTSIFEITAVGTTSFAVAASVCLRWAPRCCKCSHWKWASLSCGEHVRGHDSEQDWDESTSWGDLERGKMEPSAQLKWCAAKCCTSRRVGKMRLARVLRSGKAALTSIFLKFNAIFWGKAVMKLSVNFTDSK